MKKLEKEIICVKGSFQDWFVVNIQGPITNLLYYLGMTDTRWEVHSDEAEVNTFDTTVTLVLFGKKIWLFTYSDLTWTGDIMNWLRGRRW